jgi:predicted aminopeptidase
MRSIGAPGSTAAKARRQGNRDRAAESALPADARSPLGRYDGYDAWFEAPINNAKLAATSIYNDLVPAFLRLFDLCAGDYPRFYAAVKRLGALDRAERADALAASRTCG